MGQRRRLGLAVAVAQAPDLMLLDEPTNHLSPALAGEIEEALGVSPGAVVVASHDRWLRRRWAGAVQHWPDRGGAGLRSGAVGDVTDWFLTRAERDNDATWVDRVTPAAWSEGNRCRPLIDGVTYFRELHERLEATREGDLVLFTDWQGDADELLVADDPDSAVVEVLARADERGVDVRGLIWRSHWDKVGFFSRENRTLGEELQQRGAEALLDMRVRNGGSHHQKFVVIRHHDDPSRDIAFVGGIDLAHSRRDDHRHLGDPQNQPLAREYGERPPWHDAMVAITGPAVHDVETTFRERWEDPAPLSRRPDYWIADKLRRLDRRPDPFPTSDPLRRPSTAGRTPSSCCGPTRTCGRPATTRSRRAGSAACARGYAKAAKRSRRLIYVEDQYFWGNEIASTFLDSLVENPDLHLVCVLPLHPDLEGSSRTPQLLGRQRAIRDLMEAAPGRVAAYGLENEQGTPIYVHAKVCVIDDVWATTGSDNFNRRSWTHDSELTAAVVDRADGDRARTRRPSGCAWPRSTWAGSTRSKAPTGTRGAR